jgi:para-nitrobenzyl esterase
VGYTFLGDIDPDYADTVNVGMQDLVACLEWVRDNAHAFGGDPDNVTLFCESGGGLKVTTLLGMPSARGLFHKVILQSAMPWPTVLMSREQATGYSRRLLEVLGVDTAQPLAPQLQRLNPAQIVDAQWQVVQLDATEGGQPNGFGFSPFLDGEVITEKPHDALAAGEGTRMPLLTGFTSHEWGAVLSPDKTYIGIDESQLRERVQGIVGAGAAVLVDAYRSELPDLTPEQLLVRIVSHQWFLMSSAELTARRARVGGAPVWEYLFTWTSPRRPELFSFHGSEGSFVFATTHAVPLTHDDPKAPELARVVNAAWAHFARTGDPSDPGELDWTPNRHDEHNVMEFGSSVSMRHDPLRRLRDAWLAAQGTADANI